MILVDTSVWVEYLAAGRTALGALLDDGRVLCHPFVIGELACGTLVPRGEILDYLADLPAVDVAANAEVMHLLDSRRLHATGIGWIDLHLLASALVADAQFWTLDRRLRAVTRLLGLSPDIP